MIMSEAIAWLRYNGHHVARLANLGDKLAARVELAYRLLYGDQLNPTKQTEFLVVIHELIRRELTITERAVLENRYGYKLVEKEHGPRVSMVH